MADGAAAINRARGETVLDLKTGRKVRLCLTLEAMAAIEDLLGIESLVDMEAAFARPSTVKLAGIIVILAKGAGDKIEVEEVRKAPIQISELIAAIGAAITASMTAQAAPAPNA